MKKLTYSQTGANYQQLDPIKKLAQDAALDTAKYLKKSGFLEVSESRGESAFVWKQGDVYMASVVEGLGTKNLIADAMAEVTGKSYYDVIGHDTVAAIINDLVTVGAAPLVTHAYWAVGDNSFMDDQGRMKNLVDGWKSACDIVGVTWGGGETPTLKNIIEPNTIDLGGSAVGIIKSEKHVLNEKKLQDGDRILMLKSSGVNANGISLTRAIAKELPDRYATKLPSGRMYGEVLLTKTNIYAQVVQDLLNAGIDIHYISNITGHGMRKVMRARQEFSYILEQVAEPPEIFPFIQKHAGLSEEEMYGTYNMGMDYALFLPAADVKEAQTVIKDAGFESIDAGHIEKGPRKVVITPKNLTYEGSTLDLR